MGLFGGREEELEGEKKALKTKLSETQRQLYKGQAEVKELKKYISSKSAEIVLLNKSVAELSQTNEIISADKITNPRIIIIKIVGALLILSSLVFSFLLITREPETGVVNTLLWSLYLFSQFSGLYLSGFGTLTTSESLYNLSLYLIAGFVILSIIMMGVMLGMITLNPLVNLVGLLVVNSLGIPLIVYIERKYVLGMRAKEV